MIEPWLSADDIAAHLGVTKDAIYTWIAEKAYQPTKSAASGSFKQLKLTTGCAVVVQGEREHHEDLDVGIVC